jgi:hypothetical protein
MESGISFKIIKLFKSYVSVHQRINTFHAFNKFNQDFFYYFGYLKRITVGSRIEIRGLNQVNNYFNFFFMDAHLVEDLKDNGISNEKCFSDCSENPMCTILSSINNYVLFVNYNQNFYCPYSMSYGNGYVCNFEGRKNHFRTKNK